VSNEELEKWEDDIASAIVREWASRSSQRHFMAEDTKQDALLHWWKLKRRRHWYEKPIDEQKALLRKVVARFLSREHRRMSAKKRRPMYDSAELNEELSAETSSAKHDEELPQLQHFAGDNNCF